MGKKHDVGCIVTLEEAGKLYALGIAHIVTDGHYIQIEKEVKD